MATGRSEPTDQAAADLTRHCVHVEAVRADLSRSEGVETVWRAVQETGRPLDVAVLNAGRSIGGAFLDTDLDDELPLPQLNMASVVHLAKHVTRHMAGNARGRILIASSLSETLLPTPTRPCTGLPRFHPHVRPRTARGTQGTRRQCQAHRHRTPFPARDLQGRPSRHQGQAASSALVICPGG
ncbi:SDR family NAD(P)-dependent oxidoreductase [Streptomyces iakyrus]|uniref:SDR family NAD(P)-dependent oxidoreductase n=1 Tax=Streptomyces iakyrus TaxID=68219 RepID=UPI003D8D7BB5